MINTKISFLVNEQPLFKWLSWIYDSNDNVSVSSHNHRLSDWNSIKIDKEIITIFCFEVTSPDITDLFNQPFYKEVILKNKNTRIILFDSEGEAFTSREHSIYQTIYDTKPKQVKVISARLVPQYDNEQISTSHFKMFLKWYFYRSNLPGLPNLEPWPLLQNREYDFIYHFGQPTYDLERKIKRKEDYIDKINLHDKNIHITSLDYINEEYFKKINPIFDWGYVELLTTYNQLFKAHILLATETSYDWEDDDMLFITEKTTRTLMYGQPNFLLIHPRIKEKILEMGFKFPENTLEIKKTQEYISNLSKGDLFEWIKSNKHYYINNQKLFYDIVYEKDDITQQLIEKCINEEDYNN